MLFKTATSLAFATACLTAVATMPASAQMSQGYATPPAYQGNPGSMSGNYAPQPDQGMSAPSGGTEVITNGPQGSSPPNWSARQNVVESQRYDRLLESNRAFRGARMRRECGPITDSELRQECLASFNQDEPYAGSSTVHRSYRSGSGR
jgi:hypothetical protein